MNFKEKIGYIIIILVVLTIVVNLGTINNFLSFHTDKTINFDNSSYVVPVSWNSTDELNMSNQSKSDIGMTNGYLVFDCWDDWPENHMGHKSKARLKAMEPGGYKTVKSEIIKLGGKNVTREYYKNPSRDTETQWDCMGVVYIFEKQDKNYTIEVHYFTKQDYHNETFTKEIDDRVEDMISNMQNKNYNWYVSTFDRILNHKPIEWNL